MFNDLGSINISMEMRLVFFKTCNLILFCCLSVKNEVTNGTFEDTAMKIEYVPIYPNNVAPTETSSEAEEENVSVNGGCSVESSDASQTKDEDSLEPGSYFLPMFGQIFWLTLQFEFMLQGV